ncbi:leucine-rich repeat-containing protein 23-like [Rhopilema esculentum]|uniref:leucine-rich repeat-containing protein 23-like n=1 Tax=Rhopilema esculentum TaxID=499914 RepID=UPI0031D9FEA8|eukprot:gene6959-12580_t
MSEFSDFEDEEGVEEPDMENEDGEEKEEENVEPTDNPLTKEVVGDCLSLICKTGNGLAHAYVRLDVHERGLTDISILNCFIHLRYVDISGNKLKEITALNSLTHLLTLKADKNLLRSGKMEEMPYLQVASFANNKIMDSEGFDHPLLESLNLRNNDIIEVTGLNPKRLARLKTLELRSNKLISTKGIELPNLTRLYLAANKIRSLEGLPTLNHLVFLHLRGNSIEKLDGFSEEMANLQYLNLRQNNISELSEVTKLKCLPMLRALVLLENPVCMENGYRIEVLILLRRLERLDKDPINEEERQEAEEIYEQRRQEEAQSAGAEVIQLEEEDD